MFLPTSKLWVSNMSFHKWSALHLLETWHWLNNKKCWLIFIHLLIRCAPLFWRPYITHPALVRSSCWAYIRIQPGSSVSCVIAVRKHCSSGKVVNNYWSGPIQQFCTSLASISGPTKRSQLTSVLPEVWPQNHKPISVHLIPRWGI